MSKAPVPNANACKMNLGLHLRVCAETISYGRNSIGGALTVRKLVKRTRNGTRWERDANDLHAEALLDGAKMSAVVCAVMTPTGTTICLDANKLTVVLAWSTMHVLVLVSTIQITSMSVLVKWSGSGPVIDAFAARDIITAGRGMFAEK